MSGPDAPSRLVVRLPNWLGDAVMAIPALVAVRDAFPQSHLALAGEPSVLPVFEEDIARPAAAAARDQQEHRTQESCATGSFDAVLLLTNSFRTAWVARQSGIRERWGYAAGARGPLLTRAVRRPPRGRHQSEYYLRLVRALGIDDCPSDSDDCGAVHVRHSPSPIQPGRARRASSNNTASRPTQRWSVSRRAPPMDTRNAGRPNASRTSSSGSRASVASAPCWSVRRRSRSRPCDRIHACRPGIGVVNLIGRTDLRLLMGVIRACRAFVSNDSGAMHLAAALGIPVTAIFGPTNEKATAPLGDHDVILQQVFCRPCMLRECPIDHRCMKRISEDEVFGALTRRMDRHA